MTSRRRKRCAPAVFCAAVAAAAALTSDLTRAAVSTDGSVGPPARSLAGPNFSVAPDLGRQVGGNLFHSFSRFDLAQGETATFTGPSSVHTVLARVTGGTASNIDGTIRCTIPAADFYLVNPAGVVFGPDAKLDVQGSFAVTTANYLRLADGGKFAATASPADSVLTTAAPAAFGFLGPQKPAAIAVRGDPSTQDASGNTVYRPSLSPAAGKALVVVGGDVTVAGGRMAATGGGPAAVAAVGGAGEVGVTFGPAGSPPAVDARAAAGGRVSVAGGGFLGADALLGGGTDAGAVTVTAGGGVTVEGSPDGSFASTLGSRSGTGQAGDVRVDAGAGAVAVTGGGFLGADTHLGTGMDAGAVTVTAGGGVTVGGTSPDGFSASTLGSISGTGRAGDVRVDAGAGAVAVTGGGLLGADAHLDIGTDAGAVTVTAGGGVAVEGTRPDGFVASTLGSLSGSGRAGDVRVDAGAGAVAVTGGGFLGADASLDIVGTDAGAVTVTAGGGVTVASAGPAQPLSTLGSRSGSGQAGAVRVDAGAGAVSVTGGGFLGADASLEGTDAGAVTVTAGGGVTVEGTRPDGILNSVLGSRSGTGLAGAVRVDAGAGAVAVTGGGFLGADAQLGTGTDAGTVTVTAGGGVTVAGTSPARSSSVLGSQSGTGQAGDVRVDAGAGAVSVTGGGFLGADTHLGIGTDAGAVTVTAGGGVAVAGASPDGFSASTLGSISGTGRAGDVRVDAGTVAVTGGGFLGADAFSGIPSGTDAGAVTVTAGGGVAVGGTSPDGFSGSTLGSRSGSGRAGEVTVDAKGGNLGLNSGGVIESRAGSAGTVGRVRLSGTNLVFDGGDSPLPTGVFLNGPLAVPAPSGADADLSISATRMLAVRGGASAAADSFGGGRAGAVAVAAPDVLVEGGGSITARSFTGGGGGSVTVDAPRVALSDGTISASNYRAALGEGAAAPLGRVTVRATELTLDRRSAVSAGGGGGLADALTVTDHFSTGFAVGDIQVISPAGTRVQLASRTFSATYGDGGGEALSAPIRAPIGFLSRFVAADLNGGWKLEVRNVHDFGGNPVAATLTDWSLSLGGREIGHSAGPASGTTFDSPLTVSGQGPGLTGGAGGDVAIQARTLTLRGGSSIAGNTFGKGPAGSVGIVADRVSVSGAGSAINSGSAAAPTGPAGSGAPPGPVATGAAGAVSVHARYGLTLTDGAAVTVRSDFSNAGGIDLRAGRAVQVLGTGGRPGPRSTTATRVTAEALGEGATGGRISIVCGQLLRVQDGLVTGEAKGDGGRIKLDPPVVVLDRSVVNGLSNGTPVRVEIAAGALLRSDDRILTNTNQTFPGTDVSGAIAALQAGQPGPQVLMAPQCGLRLGGDVSSFLLTGRGGTPPQPGGWTPDAAMDEGAGGLRLLPGTLAVEPPHGGN